MVKPRTKLGEHLSPQLKDINRPWTAFLNKREFVTGEESDFCPKPWLKEGVQKPLGLLSHTIASVPVEATVVPRTGCARHPWLGPMGSASHSAALPGTPFAKFTSLLEIHPCQHGAINYFSLSNLCQQLHPKSSGLFSLWQCLRL